MKLLEERIIKDAVVAAKDVLKVDGFLNQMMDTELYSLCADEWYSKFADCGVTKILTVESSGIGLACITAMKFSVPALFAKKSNGLGGKRDLLSAEVVSFTHGLEYDITVPKKFISPEDKVLIIDDFLANGSALKALIELVKKAKAEIAGIGVAIEKAYKGGGDEIRSYGYRLEALAKIKSIDKEKNIIFD